MFDRMSRQFEGLDDELLESPVAVDVEDADGAFVVTADLPGFTAEEIGVEFAGDTLSISASHTEETEDEGDEPEFDAGTERRYLRRERRHRSVSRSVRLPEPVDREAAEAEYRNGVLTVTLPKESTDEGGQNIPIN